MASFSLVGSIHEDVKDVRDYYNNQETRWRKEAMDGLTYDLCRQELQYRTSRIDEFFSYWQKEEQGAVTHL